MSALPHWASNWNAPALQLPPPGHGYTLHRSKPWRGGFGVVYSATMKRAGGVRTVAIKFIDPTHEAMCSFELLHGAGLNHRYLVGIEEYLRLSDTPPGADGIVWPNAFSMERCFGSLARTLTVLDDDSIPVHILRAYATHLADAIEFLHHRGYVHRDIKPSNILIRLASDRDNLTASEDLAGSDAVLSDLGMLVPIRGTGPVPRLDSDRGNSAWQWKAPEVLGPNADDATIRGPEQDMWSFGQVLHYLFERCREVPNDLRVLAQHCTQEDPVRRPPAREALERVQSLERLGSMTMVAGIAQPRVDTLTAYLEWMIVQHGWLELRGIPELREAPRVELEQVYVALKGDRATARERQQARELLDSELEDLLRQLELEQDELFAAEEIERLRQLILARHPLMPSLAERDRISAWTGARADQVVSLGEAFAAERWLVILGDPGSGKTTLAKWLALTLARALLQGQSRMIVPRRQVDPDTSDPSATYDLGPPRLPILLRVAHYAERYDETQLPLIDYLGRHPWQGEMPSNGGRPLDGDELNGIIRAYLRQGKAVVILDGMDEITTADNRDDVVRAIEVFIRDWMNGRGEVAPPVQTPWSMDRLGPPGQIGGNQLVVTSRIAGYHAAPIKGDLTHCTIEPMRRPAVERFCEMWMEAVHRQAGLSGDPLAEARRLQDALFDPARPRLRELASNPLLVTTLAVVFHQRGRLPEHRSELYQLAMDILVEGWRNMGLTVEDFAHVLAPIAAHIHQHYPTGLIPARELRAGLLDSLRRRFPHDHAAETETRVHDFLTAVETGLGLLAERGQKIYGFVHLTFQEYLAALHLILGHENQPDKVAERIVYYLGSPRWREPILLALGRVGAAWGVVERDRLLAKLLDADDPLADLLPRIALLVAVAMEEMPNPSEQIVAQLVQRLLIAYADEVFTEFPLVRERIEKALDRLRQRMSGLVESALVKVLTHPPAGREELAPAAAQLIRMNDWYSDSLAIALSQALRFDSERLGFPIQACLRELVTPRLPPVPPRTPFQATPQELEQRRGQNSVDYQELLANIRLEQAHYADRLARYEVLRDRPPIRVPSPSRLQRVLVYDSELTERIRSSPAWTRLIVALYGGYPEYQANEALRERDAIAAWLQLGDGERRRVLADRREYYVERFGADDPVYSAAVFLDTGGDDRLRRAAQLPRFEPSAIFRDSPLTDRLLHFLRRDQNPTTELQSLLQNPASSPAIRLDALIGLGAWGEDVTPHLDRLRDSGGDAISTFRKRLLATRHALADAVTRNLYTSIGDPRRPAYQLFLDAASTLRGWDWRRLFRVLTRLSLAYFDRPLLYETAPKELDADSIALASAEFWAYRFRGAPSDDVIYAFAVALDRLGGEPSNAVIRAMSTMDESQNRLWAGSPVRWPVEPLSPRYRPTDGEDIHLPLEAFEAVEDVGTELIRPDFRESVRSVFLDSVSRASMLPEGSLPELLTVNLLNIHSGENVRSRLMANSQELFLRPEELLFAARRLSDPYRRARALLRLARYLRGYRSALAIEALSYARSIDCAHRRCRVMEHLLPCLTGATYETVLDEAVAAARQCPDPDDACRALARLSERFSGNRRIELLRESLATTVRITDLDERAETQARLLSFVRPHPELLAEAHRLARTILDPAAKWMALGFRGGILIELEHQVDRLASSGLPEPMREGWAALSLGAIIDDLLNYTEPAGSAESLWLTLASDPGSTVMRLEAYAGEHGLTLTRPAAEAIRQLVDAGQEELARRLLPLVQNPTADAVSLVEDWLDHWFEPLTEHAALLLAEQGRQLTAEWIDGVLSLARGREDRARARAFLLLHGGITVIRRPGRHFRASQLGGKVFRKLARYYLQSGSSQPGLATAIRWVFTDVLMDAPELIGEWVTAIAAGGEAGEEATFCLRMLTDFTPEAWQALQQAFLDGNRTTRLPLARAVCRAFLRENQRTSDPTSLEWLRNGATDLADWRILRRNPCPITSAIAAILPDLDLGSDDAIARAEQALLEQSGTGDSIAHTEDIRAWLGTFGEGAVYLADTGGSLYEHRFNVDSIIIPDERALPLLVRWLKSVLSESITNRGNYSKQTWLLFVTAEYAAREPATFANEAAANELEPLLVRAIREHDWEPGRMAAIRMIMRLKKVQTSTAAALQEALLDVKEVRDVAAQALMDLPRLEGDVLESLFDGLRDASVSVAFSSARILAALGRNERTRPEARAQILESLASAVRSSGASRKLYEITGAGTGESDHHRLSQRGRLKEVFFQSLLEVAGVL